MALNITHERPSYQAVFALDIIVAGGALVLIGLATRPTLHRLRARQFSSPAKSDSARASPLKTPLGTYLFLYPALLCFFVAYLTRFILDLLQTAGSIAYNADLGWNGRTAYDVSGSGYAGSISALSFTKTLATILFTVLLNGGVWIHSSHVQENGTGLATPKFKSKIWNTLIMLAMLGTGVGAWARGLSVRDVSSGSLGQGSVLDWSNVLHNDSATRIAYIVHEAIVVAASLSVTIEVLREYRTTSTNARGVRLPLTPCSLAPTLSSNPLLACLPQSEVRD